MDVEALKNRPAAVVTQRYDLRDTILYAIGVGFGTDPLDPNQLKFVYEEGLQTLPSICCVLAHPGSWLQDPVYAIDWLKMLHAEQSFTIGIPLNSSGHLKGESQVMAVEDRGAGRGAMMLVRKTLRDADSGTEVARVDSTVLLRGDGGGGGFGDKIRVSTPIPAQDPDQVVEYTTPTNAALIYRLSGDYNPLHADPDIARQAGFTRPILHGLCTYGIACRALVSMYCDHTPTRLRSMSGRFSAPVYPGETLRFEFFDSDEGLRFKARVRERNVVVLDRGRASFTD